MKIIGDVHGHHADYLDIIDKSDYTIQVGDFGLCWDVLSKNNVDPNRHKIIGGNHDNYDSAPNFPHYLGNFGNRTIENISFFFVRGERSVDANLRIEGKSWWRSEELDMKESYQAIQDYENIKPEIVVSHGCPASILPVFVTNPNKYHPSRTAQLLDAMLTIHRPKLWIFGHHHIGKTLQEKGTLFRCLNELEIMEI